MDFRGLRAFFSPSLCLRLCSCAVIGTYLAESIFSADFFGALSFGQWISAQGRVPREEIWSLAEAGKEIVFPGWLFAVVVSLLENFFGETGLYLLKVFAFVGLCLIASACCSMKAGDVFLGTLVACVACCGILLGADLNPSFVDLFFFALSLYVFFLFENSRRGRLGQDRFWLVLLFLLGFFYANAAQSYAFALLLFVALLYERREETGFFIPLFCFLCPGFISPYYGREIGFSLASGFSAFALDVGHRLAPVTLFQYPAAFLLLVWMMHAIFLRYSPPLSQSFIVYLSGIVSLAACASSALLPYALLLSAVSLSTIWGGRGSVVFGNLELGFLTLRGKLSRAPVFGLCWVLCCLVMVNVANGLKVPVAKVLLPAREVDYILDSNLEFPLLHEPGVGGYVQYRLSNMPEDKSKKSACSPRLKSQNPALYLKAQAVEQLGSGWLDYFSLISPETVLCRRSSALASFLSESPNWDMRFSGEEERTKNLGTLSTSGSAEFSWLVFSKRK